MEKDKLTQEFSAVVLGIIYDPAKKKILVGKRENDPNIPNLEWCFPGGKLNPGEEIDKKLKAHIKAKTGYEIKNLGAIFADVLKEKPDLLTVYFLTEVFTGIEQAGNSIVELKWVNPEEIEGIFKTKFNSRLKEFLISLK